MKTIRYDKYGDADVLYLQTEPAPTPAKDEALVRIRAFSLNELDWKVRNGDLKMMSGFPNENGIGCDLAGVIEQVGANEFGFVTGDEVIGWIAPGGKRGSYGTHALVKLDKLVQKPEDLPFEEAACLPMLGATARQALLEEANVQAEQRVLINGCTGGLGHYAVQLSKALGAHVTGTCSTDHMQAARELGADQVIDYKKQDIRERGLTFDVVLDTSKKLPFQEAKNIMAEPSIYLDPQPGLGAFVGSFVNNIFSEKKRDILAVEVKQEDLVYLTNLVDQGKLQTRVGRTFPFSEAIQAVRQAEEGLHLVGKVVVVVEEQDLA